MAISVCEVSLTESALDLAAFESDPASGAVVDFFGVVRGFEDGRELAGIEYEAHRAMAEHQMRAIAETAAARFGLRRTEIRHRIGFVPVAEASVVVRVTSGHRSAAFQANAWIMDELKRLVPIWKHPVFKEASGSAPEPLANQIATPVLL
jgi:molybdopterin synthase catalytic subunit